MLNIRIIGPGRVAERHALAIKEIDGMQLWSIGARTHEAANEFALKHNAIASNNAFSDLSSMLDDPKLNAVIIATPDKLHVDHT